MYAKIKGIPVYLCVCASFIVGFLWNNKLENQVLCKVVILQVFTVPCISRNLCVCVSHQHLNPQLHHRHCALVYSIKNITGFN